ncbi:unnamed protein product [Eretmochelys imbricata]
MNNVAPAAARPRSPRTLNPRWGPPRHARRPRPRRPPLPRPAPRVPGAQPSPSRAPPAEFGPGSAASSRSHKAVLAHTSAYGLPRPRPSDRAPPPAGSDLALSPGQSPHFSAQSPAAGPSPTRRPGPRAARSPRRAGGRLRHVLPGAERRCMSLLSLPSRNSSFLGLRPDSRVKVRGTRLTK